jgi:hypothetical protein
LGIAAALFPSLTVRAEAQGFVERWETAPIGVYIPGELTLVDGDGGDWFIGDTISDDPEECDLLETPQRAEIEANAGNRQLRLTSIATPGGCSDNVFAALFAFPPLQLNPGFVIPLAPDTRISFREEGELIEPEVGSPTTLVPPAGDTVSLLLIDNRDNVLAYILQRAPERNPVSMVPNYREIQLDPEAGSYDRNLFADFSTIPTFVPDAAQLEQIEFKVQEHGFAVLDDLVIGAPEPAGAARALASLAVLVALAIRSSKHSRVDR